MVLEVQQTFRTERVFAGIFVVGVIGFAIDLGFRRPRQWLLPWHRETELGPAVIGPILCVPAVATRWVC